MLLWGGWTGQTQAIAFVIVHFEPYKKDQYMIPNKDIFVDFKSIDLEGHPLVT